MRGRFLILAAFAATWSVGMLAGAAAQETGGAALDRVFGVPVTAVRVTADGVDVRDPQIQSLIEIRAGEPLTPAAVRRTIVHLMALGVYLDVRVRAEAADGGARVAVELIPRRDVARLVFAGDTGLPERVLRDAAVLRFGTKPPVGRATDIARTLEDVYRDHGYLRASVRPRPLDATSRDPGDLVFDVAPGTQAVVRSVQFRGAPDEAISQVRDSLALRPGAAYEPAALRRRLAIDVDAFRARGYLEARADPFVSVHAGGETVDLTVAVNRGPLVSVTFAGDPLPVKDREALVPVVREASADEDLLEDAQFGIERHLRNQGYRDARAPFTRVESAGRLTIVYTVTRGPLYRVAAVAFDSNASGPQPVQGSLTWLKPGEAFVQDRLDADVAAVAADLRRQGYARATVTPAVAFDTATRRSGEVAVRVALRVDEGPRAVVTGVAFDGVRVVAEGVLRAGLKSRIGGPYYRPAVEDDRNLVQDEYRNRGYRAVVVDGIVTLSEDGTGADIRFVVREGPQVLVDRILVVGNTRTAEATIRRELVLTPGAALGDAAVAESQRRLAALGLFRRSTIAELPHVSPNLRDVLVTVEEAPATMVGYGGGLEFQRVETSEFAPRGFFEIGRRNLRGKNRSVNLFSRVSLRRQAPVGRQDAGRHTTTNLEYRVIGSYREPRFLTQRGDLQVATVFEQGSRTSFRYRHQSARLDFLARRGAGWNYIGQFAVERNEVFDDRINPVDRPLIDRIFPQVRLSSLAATMARDTRSDPIEPVSGTLVSINAETALRQLGSQVGYAKTFLQAFAYRRLPATAKVVLAGGVRIGLGTGFPRDVAVPQPDGSVIAARVRDLPASERFFAGGDTTVRGFDTDRLGVAAVFDRDGTPIGGHAQLVANAEVRVALWKDLGLVGFVDGGNVFATVSDADLGTVRLGAGIGLRYASPVGPLRLDIGFKLGTLRTYGAERERRRGLHIGIGQAF